MAQNKHTKTKTRLVASHLEMEWAYSQRSRQIKKEINDKQVRKKEVGKLNKHTNNLYNAKINK